MREAHWTESLAVGSERFGEEVGRRIRNRMKVEIEEHEERPGLWVVREARVAYR